MTAAGEASRAAHPHPTSVTRPNGRSIRGYRQRNHRSVCAVLSISVAITIDQDLIGGPLLLLTELEAKSQSERPTCLLIRQAGAHLRPVALATTVLVVGSAASSPKWLA
jgi:hypothetical protein